jgi:hypothetical protein
MAFAVSTWDPVGLSILASLIGLSALYRLRIFQLRNRNDHPLASRCTVSIESDQATAVKIAKSAVNSLGAKVISADPKSGMIFGRYRSVSFFQIEVSPDEAGRCACVCKAWPTMETAILDFGSSRRSLRRVVDYFVGACPDGVFVERSPIERIERT